MITKQFKQLLYATTLNGINWRLSDGSYQNYFSNYLNIQSTSGNTVMGNITLQYANVRQAIGSLSAFLGIVIGSDNTIATENDYQIKSPITTGISVSGGSYNYNNNSGYFPLIVTQPITNTSGQDITIKEVGLCMGGYSSTNGYSFKNFVMLTRDNVDVTIAPNETKTFTINIDYDNNSTSVS